MVSWSNTFSSGFSVSNCIRQGGLISSDLYNVYTDSLRLSLRVTKFGWHIGGVCANHICYGDDMVIFTTSAKALQCLLDV